MVNENLHIVGIGSSAGGLEALQAFIKNIPVDENISYVIVQHLKRNYDSQLANILGKETLLPVKEIREDEQINGATIYVMPAGYNLRLERGLFKLEVRSEKEIINKAINHFFISLANEQKSKVFGVILSGTGNDGVEGVKEIERLGGIVMVQDPSTAQFDGMPENTIHKDHPDYVVSPEAMPMLIAELKENRGSHEQSRRKY